MEKEKHGLCYFKIKKRGGEQSDTPLPIFKKEKEKEPGGSKATASEIVKKKQIITAAITVRKQIERSKVPRTEKKISDPNK
ncbi:hypothetical protein [Companilactobacillus furfuricola]|uniref:hypothetical protein n=1 Tax=Companilactobacillus furfuricola TaxID=1462575 RepID=UPI0013DDB89B|nr:hypothetical protein [Companilactobacillus furfuricola]